MLDLYNIYIYIYGLVIGKSFRWPNRPDRTRMIKMRQRESLRRLQTMKVVEQERCVPTVLTDGPR